MRTFFLPLASLFLTACGHSTSLPATPATTDQLMQSGFEENLGWGGAELSSLTTEKAHGGQVAVLVSPEVPFSFTFARTLGEMGLKPGTQQLELSGWVLRTAAGSTASLVVQVDASRTDETKIYYTALPVAPAVTTFGEWKEVHLSVELPTAAVPTNRLKVYLWNDKATSPTYLDDVVLRRVAAK